MTTSPHLGFNFLETNQSQKEVTINAALGAIEALLNNGVADMGLDTPPGSPVDGDVYVVGATPTGAWTGRASDIAYYLSGWKFIDPREGMMVWVNNEDKMYVFNGSSWLVSSAAFTSGGDTQSFLNKDTSGDDAALVFQTGFSTRALIGTLGDDDFHFKVSPDGSSFFESFIVDKDNGAMQTQGFFCLPSPSTLTIASGVVTATKSHHKIDTESAAASDDLATISGGFGNAILLLQPADDARTVVIKHGTGNIKTKSGSDVSLDAYGKSWMAIWDGFNWIEI